MTFFVTFQQAVHECMKKVVNTFPPQEQDRLKPAVDNWRYPYWDWAFVENPRNPTIDLITVPELLRAEKVPVVTDTGPGEIPNPLLRYKFPLNDEGKIDGIHDVFTNKKVVAPVRFSVAVTLLLLT